MVEIEPEALEPIAQRLRRNFAPFLIDDRAARLRANVPPEDARRPQPHGWSLRERVLFGIRISSFDIAIRWATRTRAQLPRAFAGLSSFLRARGRQVRLTVRILHAIAGLSIARCASHDATVPGIKPTRP